MIAKLDSKYQSLKTDETGTMEVTFTVDSQSKYAARKMVDEIKSSDKDKLTISVDWRKKKRSLDANAYFWVLADKIAEVLITDKWDVYLELLERYGVFTHVIAKPHVVERVKEEWRTVKELGEVIVNGEVGIQLQCYFGSSTYDSKEMSRLIEGAVDEAKELGIETATPQEVAGMVERWGK